MDKPKLRCDTLKKVWEVVHCALPAKFLVDDTQAYILKDFEGVNPVSAPRVCDNVVAVVFGQPPKSVK